MKSHIPFQIPSKNFPLIKIASIRHSPLLTAATWSRRFPSEEGFATRPTHAIMASASTTTTHTPSISLDAQFYALSREQNTRREPGNRTRSSQVNKRSQQLRLSISSCGEVRRTRWPRTAAICEPGSARKAKDPPRTATHARTGEGWKHAHFAQLYSALFKVTSTGSSVK